MSEYIPLPHCRHRATEGNGKGGRHCTHCGAITHDDYWEDGWDEWPEPKPKQEKP